MYTRYPDLAGRTAVVTGGSRGIGAETARALAANGVEVVVNGRDRAALDAVVASITSAGGRAVGVAGDITDPDVAHLLRTVAEESFGPASIIVPFAGGQGAPVPVEKMSLGQWRSTLDSDLTSTFITVTEFLPGMIERGAGSIITMASTAARQVGLGSIAYAAAKAGVLMFTRNLADQLGKHGIRANAVSPSAVLNDRMRTAMTDEQLVQLATHFPLQRIGQPVDVAQAVIYLASDASSWITGVTLDITGGRVIV
jgi:3-oxoacyl-[acyl-carrier protein] reductase